MNKRCIPKHVFHSYLSEGLGNHGGQLKRYQDHLKASLKAFTLNSDTAHDRTSWRSTHRSSTTNFEKAGVEQLIQKRQQRKSPIPSNLTAASSAAYAIAYAVGALRYSHTGKHADEFRRVDLVDHHHISDLL